MNTAGMDLQGKVAVITGGADGIGLGAAKQFRAHGAKVVIGDVNEAQLKAKASEFDLTGVVCDVCNEDHVDQLAAAATALGDVALIMANAGVAVGGRFEQVPTSEWQRLFDVNVLGVVRTINAFLPAMMDRGYGTIVITGSSAGLFTGNGFDAPYAASKYALRGMAQGLAVYARSSGIGVHYLAPRITDTAFPKSSIAWGRKGSRVTTDRELGNDYDSVDDVIGALVEGIQNNEFLISLTPETQDKLAAYAENPLGEP